MKKIHLYILGLTLTVVVGAYVFSTLKAEEPFKPLLKRQGPISATSEWLNAKAAIEGLQRQLRDDPNDNKSKLLLALAYMQEARVTGEHPYYYPASLDLLNSVIKSGRKDKNIQYEALVAKATVLLSLHNFSEALEVGHEALQVNTTNASVYGVLCDANVELGSYEEAVKMADKMVSIRPDLRSYSRVSYLREIYGDMPGSIEAMKLAVSAGLPGLEQTAWARITLGQLYEKTGDLQSAEVQYEMAKEEYPHYPFAFAGLGRLAVKRKSQDEAIQLFTKAGSIIPEFSFYEELAHLYKKNGNKKELKEITKELLEMLQEDSEAGHNVDLELANIYLEILQDNKKALEYAAKEYKRRPDNIDVSKTMAYIHYIQKDYKTSAKYLVTANKTNKHDPFLLCLTGLVNYHLGEKEKAAVLVKKSLEMDPFQENELIAQAKALSF